jgi:hypothetical protein
MGVINIFSSLLWVRLVDSGLNRVLPQKTTGDGKKIILA